MTLDNLSYNAALGGFTYLGAISKVELCTTYLNIRKGLDVIDKILVHFTCAKTLHKKVALS